MGYRHENDATPPAITAADAGTWLDGAMGWHNTYRVVRVAQTFGMTLSDEDEQMITRYEEGAADVAEEANDLSDKATDYLQSLAPEGYYFEWDMGELCLVNHNDDEEDE